MTKSLLKLLALTFLLAVLLTPVASAQLCVSLTTDAGFNVEVSGVTTCPEHHQYAIVCVSPERGASEYATEIQAKVPAEYVLEAAYPNPFNPQTTIRFDVPESGLVRLVVYDVLGRQVSVLLDGVRKAGTHEEVFAAGNLPSGTYLVRLETPTGSFVQTMQLLK